MTNDERPQQYADNADIPQIVADSPQVNQRLSAPFCVISVLFRRFSDNLLQPLVVGRWSLVIL
jgi:hypothetical protein